MPTNLPERFRNENIILIVSNFEPTTRDFIADAKRKAENAVIALDINRDWIFNGRPRESIEAFLSYVDLVQINQKNFSALRQKLNIASDEEFLENFDLKLLTITQGIEGARFVYRTEELVRVLEKKTVTVSEMKDPTGAGDAFHAMMLKAYREILARGEPITEAFLNRAFVAANKLAGLVVTVVGARGPVDLVEGLFREENGGERRC
jgi:sugar/nucleoside kinase (ribokinase family)